VSNKTFKCEVTVVDEQALTVLSRMAPAIIKSQHPAEKHQLARQSSWLVENTNTNGHQILPFYPDIEMDSQGDQGGRPYLYVEIANSEKDTTVRQVGLIVRQREMKSPGDKQVIYERVGLA
jgi:hypothetical protein